MEYFIAFIGSFIAVVVLIFIFKRIGSVLGFVDVAQGDALKIHKIPVSYLGGAAMFGAAVIALLGFQLWVGFDWKIGGIILASLFVFMLGFWDDCRWKHISQIRPHLKFFLLLTVPLLASLVLVWSGLVGSLLMVLIAFLAIFILMNAINYQDGMDGLAGGMAAVSLAGFAATAVLLSSPLALVLALIFLGAVLGFLMFNLPPARIFMGDSGAYFLGFCLAVLFLLFFRYDTVSGLIGLFLILGVPLAEGVFTNMRRMIKGKSIFLGDRSHVYDIMLQRGYSVQTTLFVFYAAQLVSVAFGVLLLLGYIV